MAKAMLVLLVAVCAASTVVAVEDVDGEVAALDGAKTKQEAALSEVQKMISSGTSSGGTGQCVKKNKELQREVAKLRIKVQTIEKETTIRLQSKLNVEKEKYHKKMLHSASYKGKLEKVSQRCANEVANAMARAAKYKALMQVMSRKAAQEKDAEKAIDFMQSKLKKSAEGNDAMAAVVKQDEAKLAAAAGQKAAPSAPSEDCDKLGDIKKRIACEKKKAASGHQKAAKLHLQAASHHAKNDDKAAAKRNSVKAKAAKKTAKKILKKP